MKPFRFSLEKSGLCVLSEVAAYHGVEYHTAHSWVRRGALKPSLRIGQVLLFAIDDVKAFTRKPVGRPRTKEVS